MDVSILRPRPVVDSLLVRAEEHASIGEVHHAETFYTAAVAADTGPTALLAYGSFLVSLGELSEGKTRYEVEHIWADHPERHSAEFSHPADFAEHRNRIGGLLLLPKSFNASYGDLTYVDKLPHYNTQNLLARSLHPQCYDHNPGFLRFREQSGLPFAALPEFNKVDLEGRSQLYRQIAERIWNPADLLKGVTT